MFGRKYNIPFHARIRVLIYQKTRVLLRLSSGRKRVGVNKSALRVPTLYESALYLRGYVWPGNENKLASAVHLKYQVI